MENCNRMPNRMLHAKERNTHANQGIDGNDQNAPPSNQKTAGDKLDRTSWLMFYGSWRHLESFSGGFCGANMFAGMSSPILSEKFGI